MKKIDIYWFSGTGNSLLIAKEMKVQFEELGIDVNLFPIEKTDPKNIDLNSTIGIVTAVAMQGTYRMVWDFIENLPDANETKIFFADTLGTYSGGILGPVKNILTKKGYETLSAKEFKMPSNYNRDSKAGVEDREIIESSRFAVKKFCEDIAQEKESWNDIPIYSTLVSGISRSKLLEKLFRKIMRVRIDRDRCIKCGVCVKLCPVQNLSGEGVPVPEDKCILCQRCVGFCPKTAISMSSKQAIQYKAVETKEMLNELKD